jgi:transcriptional regulator of acetoin/glycerol metabolism
MMTEENLFYELFELALGLSASKFGVPIKAAINKQQREKINKYEWLGNLREMLEMADGLIVACLRNGSINIEDHNDSFIIPESIFNRVFSQFSYFTERLSNS